MRRFLGPLIDTASRTPLVRSAVYLSELLRFYYSSGARPSVKEAITDYPAWRSDRRRSRHGLEAVPWLPYSVTRFLRARLTKQMRVFEFGSGGSTLFLAERTASVVSVEHDPEWSAIVSHELEVRHAGNVTMLHVAPSDDSSTLGADATDPNRYVSSDPVFAGKSFRDYARSIDRFGRDGLDVVIIDGRSRPSCFQHAWSKIAPGGFLVLDNSNRHHYRSIAQTLDAAGWRRLEFAGAVPFNRHFAQTTVWERPRN